MNSKTLALTQELISRASVTPEDAGCQSLLNERLAEASFHCEALPFGNVKNLWARHGQSAPLLVFAGHTDVVPTGPLEHWHSDPFKPDIRDGLLYGRGAADMKASLAAIVVACEQFIAQHPQHKGSIGLLITSDEEGLARDGTRRVMQTLHERDEKIDYCLVGEPSCANVLGDTLRRGRRGSLTGNLIINGIQGHVAYPDKADNPVHKALPILDAWCQQQWDAGHPDFPATSFQIANIQAGTGANNVIPGTLTVQFNFRYCPASTAASLQQQIEQQLKDNGVDYELDWHDSGQPFYTPEGPFLSALESAISEITRQQPELSTGGGTSDGRFIAPYGTQVVEFGPINASIHKINECVRIDDLQPLTGVYQRLMEKILL